MQSTQPAEHLDAIASSTCKKCQDFSSMIESHNLFVTQANTDLNHWQQMCTQLLALFNMYSGLEHSTIQNKLPGLKAILEEINVKLPNVDPKESDE